jgi:hypothetical protein
MRPCPRSKCRSRRARALAAVAAVGAALATLAARPGTASAQACCSGGSIVTPTRLAPYEDWGVGVQERARSNLGSFGADGRYVAAGGGDAEQVMEQDLAVSYRIRDAQVGLLLPTVVTHRRETGIDEWGGGVGDLSLTARWDALLAADAGPWPGVSVLAGATLPTGTPADQATNRLSTDATGAGTYDVTLGIGLEKVTRHTYFGLSGWATHRFDRSLPDGAGGHATESFALRWTALAVGGYVFTSRAALALYASLLDESAATIGGVESPASSLRLTTVGAAGVLPFRDVWRAQVALFSDVMLPAFGRNEPAGIGLTASLVRVWM